MTAFPLHLSSWKIVHKFDTSHDDPYWFLGQKVKGQAHIIICYLLLFSFINEIFIVCEYMYALVL